MTITLVDASAGKSRMVVRQIARKLLAASSENTWSGVLDDSQIKSLIESLQEQSEPSMSVSLWQNSGRSNARILAEIGQVSTSEVGQPDTLRLMGLIVELAALFHDLGKSTDGFQDKLRLAFDPKKRQRPDLASDPVRHELISTFIVADFIDHIERDGWRCFSTASDVARWFRHHASQAIARRKDEYETFKVKLEGDEFGTAMTESSAPKPFDFGRFEQDTFASSLLWLVLTHHKLPKVEARHKDGSGRRRRNAQKETGISLSASVAGYVNTNVFTRLDPFFKIKDPDADGHPWTNKSWCSRVARVCNALSRRRHELPSIRFMEPSSWVTALMYMGRPALVFADHLASSRREQGSPQIKSKGIFANTIVSDEKVYLADTLGLHLVKTNWESARYFHILFRKEDHPLKRLEMVTPDEISDDLRGNSAPEPYHWQNHLDTAAEETEGRPTLSFIMAETGTGKTRGCIKLAHALSPNGLRVTVGLGLRTLADQTYHDYLQYPISLPDHKVGRMIGSFYPMPQPQEKSPGTGASEHSGESVFMESGDKKWMELPQAEIFDGRKAKMFTKAVTAMTIDNIIQAVSVRSGIDAHILMHLMHSDLIVDEIDNFSPADLSFVTVLVHVMGFYGRNVILATATINEIIVQAMTEAYERGWEKRQELIPTPAPRVALIQSKAPFHHVMDLSHFDQASYRHFITPTKGAAVNQRHKPEILECVEHRGNERNVYGAILDKALGYSKTHCIDIEGLSYSAGFIRFNTVKTAQAFTLWLMGLKDFEDTHLEVVCYHSKTTAFERYIQEYYLNNLMKRKGQSLPEDIEAARSQLFQRARDRGKRRVCLLVVTTNIIEVGRDHDYDWCVLEPSSLASYIQSIGRVLRHRKTHVACAPNIAVLNAPCKVLRETDRIWAYPGIETPDVAARESHWEGFYRLKDYPEAAVVRRAGQLGIRLGEPKKPQNIVDSIRLLGPALLQPSNQWALAMPESYERLPEHALNLIRLNDYLRKDGVPANKRDRAMINAGNITHYSGFQVAQALGVDVSFRASSGQVSLTCRTTEAVYGNEWISDLDGHSMEVSIAQVPNDRFFLSHIDRDRVIRHYLRRFDGNEQSIQSNLFQVTLYKTDTQDLNFNCHLGMCRSDILELMHE